MSRTEFSAKFNRSCSQKKTAGWTKSNKPQQHNDKNKTNEASKEQYNC